LSGNNFTSVGLDKFVLELRDNAILEELILDNNNFSGRQITCLANLFSDTQSLKKFSAEKCEMDEFAGESIKNGLMRNMTLLELYLKENSLYDAGCAFICEALSSNTCLKKIDLSENRFREKSGVAIGSMLKANTTLE
jgi:Ran GTPase-activating protein (RanGAP) involved in mRNA processing and transport